MTETRGDSLRIFIRDCRVDLRVGICEKEKEKPQPVLISVECEVLPDCRYDDIEEKTLDRIVDYDAIHTFICRELSQQPHVALLETVAEQIASFCLGDKRVLTARVRIEKISIYPDAAGAGVELLRTRS